MTTNYNEYDEVPDDMAGVHGILADLDDDDDTYRPLDEVFCSDGPIFHFGSDLAYENMDWDPCIPHEPDFVPWTTRCRQAKKVTHRKVGVVAQKDTFEAKIQAATNRLLNQDVDTKDMGGLTLWESILYNSNMPTASADECVSILQLEAERYLSVAVACAQGIANAYQRISGSDDNDKNFPVLFANMLINGNPRYLIWGSFAALLVEKLCLVGRYTDFDENSLSRFVDVLARAKKISRFLMADLAKSLSEIAVNVPHMFGWVLERLSAADSLDKAVLENVKMIADISATPDYDAALKYIHILL